MDCHSFSRDLPNPGLEPGSPALQTDALPSEPPGKWEKVSIYPNLPAHTWRSQNLRRDPSHPIARALPNIEVGPVWGPSSDWSAHCRIALKQPTGLLFNHPAGSDSLPPHELQHTRPPCPSPSPRVCPSSCPLSRWYHPTISSSVTFFSFCLQSFPASVNIREQKRLWPHLRGSEGFKLCLKSVWWVRKKKKRWLIRFFKLTQAFKDFGSLESQGTRAKV